ncbi:MAG: LamG-like jellyroll fold domain-containing protein, partial [Solirubrobacterales bacterium]
QTTDNPLWIGGNSPYGEYFQGLIDEVRVYDRALSQADIQADMNAPIVDF